MKIKSINDNAFSLYGCVHKSKDFRDVYEHLQSTPMAEDVVYVASEKTLESTKSFIENKYFGEMPIQIGYCNGMNLKVTALEYHKASEIIVAGTDLILVLGHRKDIDEHGYDVKHAESFLMKSGDVVEIYGPTLHYCPVMTTDNGFKAAIILPKSTNTAHNTAAVYAKNKWLYAHRNSDEVKGHIAGYLNGDMLTFTR